MSDYLDPNNDELLRDFFVEAESQIELLEQNILVLESDTANSDAIDEIFRAAHTLKGASATVQMDELTGFTHVLEDLLDEIRSGAVGVVPDLVDNLLAGIDVVKEMIEFRKSGQTYSGDVSSLKNRLKAYYTGTDALQADSSQSATVKENKPLSGPSARSGKSDNLSGIDHDELLDHIEPGHSAYEVTVDFDEDNPMNTVGGIQIFAALKSVGHVLKTNPDFEQLYEDIFFPQVLYYISSAENADTIVNSIQLPDVTKGISIRLLTAEENTEPYQSEEKASRKESTAISAGSTDETDDMIAAMVKDVHGTEHKSPISAAQNNPDSGSRSPNANEIPGSGTKEEPENIEKKQASVHQNSSGSILRVDSRRIDNLLNLVSETVINKASFNQISTEFGETLSQLQSRTSQYREMVKELFDSLPDYIQRMQNGETIKEVKGDTQERFGQMYGMFDGFEGSYKNTVAKFRNTSQNLGRITSELQEGVMRIRMVPISQIFSRFPRLVRDLSRSLDKKIILDIEGEDTELDKSVIEDLLDPLIHCVRNSIDHGIENPADRISAGKTPDGHVKLRASNEGNMILIEISDDGKGIDIDAVRKKAIDRGVIHPSKSLSDIEAFNLIFDPGFSTAKEITNISGRGVGLDVVKKQIEKLNGNVSVQSTRGQGTKFIIKIPLTLAIIQGLLVRVGKEMYAIPITSVVDSHRIKPSDIKMIDNYEVFNVREDVVSLLRLNRLFKINASEEKEYFFVVIVGSGDKRMGLVVDQLIGEEDVVIKPLRDHYTNVPGIAGANITGDGTVSLIIDVSQLLDLGMQQEKALRNLRQSNVKG
ncbi:chemotaxis protein CheW [Spirochaeta dissipatitropha]